MFEFKIRATEEDPTGYYYPRWDLAKKITVTAETESAVLDKAKTILGDKGKHRGWPWTIVVDDIQEI